MDRTDGTTETLLSAREANYEVVAEDIDKFLKLKVTFTDNHNFEETLTSVLTASVPEVGVCSRTVQVREAIVRAISSASNCAEVSDSDLAGLNNVLELSGRGITTLKPGDFRGLTNLVVLHLGGNSLTELPDGLFDDLSNLQVLWLYRNSITELPDGAFDDLPELTGLRLHENSLTRLPDGIFDNNRNWSCSTYSAMT